MITSSPAWAITEIAPDVPMPETESTLSYASSPYKASSSKFDAHTFNLLSNQSQTPLSTLSIRSCLCSHSIHFSNSSLKQFVIKLSSNTPIFSATFSIKHFLPSPPATVLRPMSLFSQSFARAAPSPHAQISRPIHHVAEAAKPSLTERFQAATSSKQAAICTQIMLRSRQDLTLATNWLQKEQQQQDQQENPQHQTQELEAPSHRKSEHSFHYTSPCTDLPILEPPRIGVFALYYILTKVGIVSDALSHWETKQHIQSNQEEMDAVHKARLEELQKALTKEEETKRWSVSVKVFSWLTAFMSLIAGLVMIVTGVGAVAGALLVAGGVFTLTNQVLEVTGGWEKIAGLLPGDSPEKKRAIVMWMQLGISVLCLILAGAGIFFGGYANVGEAMNQFMAVFGGIVLIGQGVSSIGQGVTLYLHKEGIAESRIYARRLVELKYRREDLMEKVEASITRMKQLFEDMAHALDFADELFRSDQMVLGR